MPVRTKVFLASGPARGALARALHHDAGTAQTVDHPAIGRLFEEEPCTLAATSGPMPVALPQIVFGRCAIASIEPNSPARIAAVCSPDESNAQTGQHARQAARLRAFDRRKQLGDTLLAHPRHRLELLGIERVDVGDVVHEPERGQALGEHVAQSLDVHRTARREVPHALVDLRGAGALVQRDIASPGG